jgi:glucokinase
MSARVMRTLLGDIGATNARFALLTDGTVGAIEWFTVAEYAQFADALSTFIKRSPDRSSAKAIALAVAAPIKGERITMINCPWVIDAAELRAKFGFTDIKLLNDFEATAFSLPLLAGKDLVTIGGGEPLAGAPRAVLGPGTGLGVAGLVVDAGRPIVVASEGGHVTIAATSAREEAVIGLLRRKLGHISAERVISGAGLENLYHAICELDGADAQLQHAADITRAALDGTSKTAVASLDMFCAMLGTIAGNVALTFGARGGVYIAGGIAPRILDYLKRSAFRARFEDKGRYRDYLAAIPTHVIVHPEATIFGLKSVVERAA